MNRSKVFLASAALLVLAAAGCASSSSSGGGSASKLTGTGSPVDLLVIATTQSPAFSYPESNSGAEAAAVMATARSQEGEMGRDFRRFMSNFLRLAVG